MPADYNIIPYGDSAFLVQYQTDSYSEAVTDHIHALIDSLRPQKHWTELVPGYNSLLACFCPAQQSPQSALASLKKSLNKAAKRSTRSPKTIDIPVCYGGEFGPDISTISKSSGLSESEIIALHCGQTYKVCMMGFVPGFTFLSEAPMQLHHARRPTPRTSVAPGSVGIAGWQTGIYGLESPGGWQIIGRTPLHIFDALRPDPFLLSAGDHVRFVPAGPEVFDA